MPIVALLDAFKITNVSRIVDPSRVGGLQTLRSTSNHDFGRPPKKHRHVGSCFISLPDTGKANASCLNVFPMTSQKRSDHDFGNSENFQAPPRIDAAA